jgi:hypothetical protein
VFIGHYGPGAAVAGGRIRLWHAFVAVQLLDILWAPFVLLGIEHLRIAPNFTASNHFDLYDMPYTHSLPAALGWSVAAALVYRLLRKSAGARSAVIVGALVFSHWLFDFATHKPDLELWFGGPKVGLALWDHRLLSLTIEFALLATGLALFISRTAAKSAAGKILPFVLFALLAAGQIFGTFGPPPPSPEGAAMTAGAAYALGTLLASLTDATRKSKTP